MDTDGLTRLRDRLHQAGGGDHGLDRDLAQAFGLPEAAYTESVDLARQLAGQALPGWKLHVGFDASGVLPYAAVRGPGGRVDGTGPTVPLAILRVVLDAAVNHRAAATAP